MCVLAAYSRYLIEHSTDLFHISAADLENTVNKDVCAVIVGCEHTCDEAVHCIVVINVVVLDIYKTYLVIDVYVEGRTDLDSNNVAVACLLSFVDSVYK